LIICIFTCLEEGIWPGRPDERPPTPSLMLLASAGKKGGNFMAEVEKRKEDSIDKALRRFKTKLRREGVFDELKKREYYEKPSEKRRHDLAKAKRKEARRRQEDW